MNFTGGTTLRLGGGIVFEVRELEKRNSQMISIQKAKMTFAEEPQP